MFKILCITILSLSFLVIFRSNVSASIIEKVHTREFKVNDEYLEVKEIKHTKITQPGYQIASQAVEAFTIFNPIEGDPQNEDKLQSTLDSIVITDQFGNVLSYSIEETDSKNYVIKTNFPFTVNFNQEAILTLKYNSYGLLVNSGAIKDIYIPGFPKDYIFADDNSTETIKTQVIIPDKYKEINFVSPEQSINKENGFRTIEIPSEDLIGSTTWIQIGTTQYYTFNIRQEIPKSSTIPVVLNTFKMLLPRDINSGPISQKVYFTEISPSPYEIKQDKDQNLIAVFKTSSSESITVTIKGFAVLIQDNNFNINKGGDLSSLSEEMKSQYLNSGKYWEVNDPKIQAVAKQIKGTSNDIYEITNKTYDYVVNLIDYSFVKKYGINERQGALKTLNGGAAVCMEYADLFITLMRAQGVPARAAFGFGYGSLDYESRQDKSINHQWAEVFIPSINSWINVDTTWGDFGSEIIGGDLNHFYSHVASIDPETPSTSEVSFFGNISNIPKRDMKIEVASNIEGFSKDMSFSQQELLDKFPEKSFKEKYFSLFIMQIKEIDNYSNHIFINKLNIENSTIQDIFKVFLILFFPIIFILKKLIYKKPIVKL